MRNTLKIIGIVLLATILLLSATTAVLNTRGVQMAIIDKVSSELSEHYGTPIRIGSFRYKFFNNIHIEDVYIEDLNQDTLLYAQSVNTEFRFWKLFKREIRISDISLRHIDLNLTTDTQGKHNFAFLLNPRSKDREFDFNLLFEIPHVSLDSTNISYRKLGTPARSTAQFTPNDIQIKNLSTVLALNHLASDSLNAQIKSLSLGEQSGLRIDNVQARIIANTTTASIPQIRIDLPNSYFSTTDIRFDYDSLAAFRQWESDIRFDLPRTRFSWKLSDLAALVPPLGNIEGRADFSGKLAGTVNKLQISQVTLNYAGLPLMRGEADFNGLPAIEETFVYANIIGLGINKARLQDIISDYKNEPYVLPSSLDQIGNVRFSGNISGFLGNIVAFGLIQTDIGNISTDILLNSDFDSGDIAYSGKIATDNLQLGAIIGTNHVGDIAFSAKTSGEYIKSAASLGGTMEALIKSVVLKDYEYNNIIADGAYNSNGFDGLLTIDDPNLQCSFAGLLDFSQDLPEMNFSLEVDTLHLHELNLTPQYAHSNLTFKSKINISGSSTDMANGYAIIDSIRFENNNQLLAIDEFSIHSDMSREHNKLIVKSDLLNATVKGKYQLSTLKRTLNHLLASHFPNIISPTAQNQIDNQIAFDIYISGLDSVSQVLELPIRIPEMSIIKGRIDETANIFDLQVGIPQLKTEKQQFKDITLQFNNQKDQLNFSAYTQIGKKDKTDCYLHLHGKNDSIRTRINWHNTDSTVNSGSVRFATAFHPQKESPRTTIDIEPSYVVINDSVWRMYASKVQIKADTLITINNFKFASNEQYIEINGTAGKTLNDSINLNLKDLKVGYILSLIPSMNPNLTIDGHATGTGRVYSALSSPLFDANIHLRQGSINNVVLGDLDAIAAWDRSNEQIMLTGEMTKDKDTVALAQGVIIPRLDSIHFDFDGHGIDLAFIDRYTQDILKDLRGKAYGRISMFGNTKERRTHFAGNALVSEGSLGIEELNTRYYFQDTVRLSKDQIRLDGIRVTDSEGNNGTLNGEINHDGTFKDFRFDLNVDCQNVIGLNTNIEQNDAFFGKVYATGNVKIKGDEQETTITVRAKTEPNSNFNISLASASNAIDNSFITFTDNTLDVATSDEETVEEEDDDEGSRLRLILHVEATPEATMQMIIDPKTGDAISGRGAGNVRFELTPEDEMKLLGTYTIESGSYTFTLQNVIRRDFRIAQGSSISWIGDPEEALVDIKALYNTTASLRDLKDEDLLNATSRTNVPVSCVLNLSGELMRPDIKFDLDLPNSDDAIKERLRNIINTEEMMNRQIIYLLVFSKFYTPEYLQTSTISISTNDAYSLLTSTVTSQINNWISQLTTDFSFGFNIRAFEDEGQGTSQEYETEFLYQPNNRLAINGNFGYRNDDITEQKVFGDIDIEYMLDRAGKLRAKAYTHSVDRYKYLTDDNKTTMQGLGVIYKEDFNSACELFREYAAWFKRIFTKRDKKTKKDKNRDKKNEKK